MAKDGRDRREYYKEYYKVKKNYIINVKKKYYKKNKIKIHSRRRKRYELNDNNFKISTLIRTSFRKALKIYTKSGKTKILKEYGIDIKTIVEHLGNPPQDGRKYHIDHIFPVSAFDLNNPEHIRLCWHPDNLQWLEESKNCSKRNKYDEKLFKIYLNEHLNNIS